MSIHSTFKRPRPHRWVRTSKLAALALLAFLVWAVILANAVVAVKGP